MKRGGGELRNYKMRERRREKTKGAKKGNELSNESYKFPHFAIWKTNLGNHRVSCFLTAIKKIFFDKLTEI